MRAAEVSTSLPTVASVDLARYLGRWYEIARLPNRFECKCASDVEAEYRLEPGGPDRLVRDGRRGRHGVTLRRRYPQCSAYPRCYPNRV
ncbi:lipocalin family protein [Roseateles sp.]|uniref:lipocalin family protein n=1 Tax=Roseateles sp. TaxID=1971397 RepID=UPI0025D8500A|nr:lipocalin family protein [Roseateles sp.]